MEIIADTLAEAHEGAVDAVLSSYKDITIQTHHDKAEFTFEFEAQDGSDEVLTIKVLHPLKEPQISQGARFKEGFAGAYKKQFLTLTPPRPDGKEATYTYWNRHEDFPNFDIDFAPYDAGGEPELETQGDGDGRGIKQITSLIEKLARDPNSRRAVSITWCPYLDKDSTEPPCMLFVQFVIRKGKVNMRTLFRSQDILSGLGENLIGCSALLEYVVNGINKIAGTSYAAGTLILISIIPHIYRKRDDQEYWQMLKVIHTKKITKSWNVKVIRE